MGESYSSAEMRSVYSAAQANWTKKENSEFKPAKLHLKIDLVSYPAHAERGWYIHICIYTCWPTLSPNDELENFVNVHIEAAAECQPTKLRAKQSSLEDLST